MNILYFPPYWIKTFHGLTAPSSNCPCTAKFFKRVVCTCSLILPLGCLDLALIIFSSSLLCWNWSCQGQHYSPLAKASGHFWFNRSIGVSGSSFLLETSWKHLASGIPCAAGFLLISLVVLSHVFGWFFFISLNLGVLQGSWTPSSSTLTPMVILFSLKL